MGGGILFLGHGVIEEQRAGGAGAERGDQFAASQPRRVAFVTHEKSPENRKETRCASKSSRIENQQVNGAGPGVQ